MAEKLKLPKRSVLRYEKDYGYLSGLGKRHITYSMWCQMKLDGVKWK